MRTHPGFRAALIAFGPLLVLGGGCTTEKPPVPLFPASGRVLMDDKPLEGVQVRFFDANQPTNLERPIPYAVTDTEGRFQLSTFRDGDGAPVGEYAAMLLWPEGPPGPGAPRDRLGNAFTNPAQSPFRATLAQGGTEIPPFRIDPVTVRKATAQRDAANRRARPEDSANPAGF